MEFSISSAQLLKGIMEVSKAIPSKTTLPILENFLFNLKDGKLEITASDQELTLRTRIEVDGIKEEGSIAVPARQIMDLLKELPDQPIRISTKGDNVFECNWSNGNSSLPYWSAADYPEIRLTSQDAQSLTIDSAALTEGISSTVYATADDEMRPAMNGIFFDINPESTTLVASDSHKLICYTTKDCQAAINASFILHKKPAGILKASLDKEEGNVEINFDDSNVVFKFGDTMMVCRLIVGKYPKYRDVIPQNNANVLKIERSMFLNAIRRVAVCANKASNYIKFDLKDGQIEITAQDLGFSLEAYEKINCDYSGDPLTIGFKSSFLVEILNNLSCDTLVMKFADSRRAALILPSEDDESSENICGIIMPILV